MKKRVFFLLTLLVVIPLISSFVSAQYYGYGLDVQGVLRQTYENGVSVVRSVFEVLIGDSGSNDFFFAKSLFAILIFFVIYGASGKITAFQERKKITLVVSIIMAILAVRYIDSDSVIASLLLPYTTLGIAISVFLPLAIFFYFVENLGESSFIRRSAWVAYGVIFFSVYISRMKEIGGIGGPSIVYFIGLIAIFAVAIFDRSIHHYFGLARAEKVERQFKMKQIVDIESDLNKYRANSNPSREMQQLINQLERKHRQLLGSL